MLANNQGKIWPVSYLQKLRFLKYVENKMFVWARFVYASLGASLQYIICEEKLRNGELENGPMGR